MEREIFTIGRQKEKMAVCLFDLRECYYALLVATGNFSYNSGDQQKEGVPSMLNENMKAIRKSKGLSQQELAVKLNVVRQTISKWEQGLSVPDSDMLISVSEVLETPVSTLLGETVIEAQADDLKAISEKLEVINLQLAQRKTARKRMLHGLLIALCVVIVAIFAILCALKSPYLGWNYSDPETAVLGVAFHSFEWLFVRVAPIILAGAIVGIFLTRKKD